MTIVTAQMTISLDGYYAGPRATGIEPHDVTAWMQSPEAQGFMRITQWIHGALAWRERHGLDGGTHNTNSEIIDETFNATGAYVIGRRMADGGEVGWGDEPPFHAPVFVVTNRPRPTLVKQGGTSFTYVTDGIANAIDQARQAAGNRNVAIGGGGNLLNAAIRAGLVDELELHVAPVLLGTGMRLFEPADPTQQAGDPIELTPTRVIHTDDVTHIRYRARS